MAAGSSTSTASSAGRTTSTTPRSTRASTPVEPEKSPEEGYHLTEDLTDHAIDWVRTQKALAPDKPFFVYFAPGATHAPHHVPPEWADKYAGQFAGGWDAQREPILERQKQRGVVPADAELTARPEAIPAWDDMDDALKPVLERQMEVYAGFLEHTDYHVGRLIDTLESIGALDNTLVYYIIGDNGASAEGTRQRRVQRDGELQRPRRDRDAGVHGVGEGQARHGGRLQPLLGGLGVGDVHALPVDQAGRLALGRHPQRHDRALAGRHRQQGRDPVPVLPRHRRRPDRSSRPPALPEPDFVNGVQQAPIEGTSMVYSFDEADAPERHDLQYFEMAGNRGIYYKGWSAVTRHSTPWLPHEVLPAAGRRRVGALRRHERLDPGARPRRRDAGDGSRRCNGCG